ncbi:glycosyltransferase [Aurantiacibacter flavus]
MSGEIDSLDTFEWLIPVADAPTQGVALPHALELDHLLWRGFHDRVLPRLRALLDRGPPVEQAAAGWVLGRWDACQQDIESAHKAIMTFHAYPEGARTITHPGPFLLAVDLCLARREQHEGRLILEKGVAKFGETPDFSLARFLLARADGRSASKLASILREPYAKAGLTPLILGAGDAPLFDRIQPEAAPPRVVPDGKLPLVSVIVPVFNASKVLPHALHGLLEQTWPAMEIIVVDDGSSDESVAAARAIAARNARLRVVELGKNEGAYPARNRGFAEARGTFVTVHDADDWSHPQKIEMQARALLDDPALKASVSHWVRASNDLEMTRWRMEDGWVHRNLSSLMLRTALRDELGFWDRTRANADTEYYYRIIHAHGLGAIREVYPGIPLAFGRTQEESLTSNSATHLRTQLHGVRHDYMEAAHDWHRRAARPSDLYLPLHPRQRPFQVPAEIAVGDPDSAPSEFDVLHSSGLLDEEWYQLAYPDVLQAGIGATRHYLTSGAVENRDPGPRFSTSGYRVVQRLGPSENPLSHYLREGEGSEAQPLPTFEGKRAAAQRGKRVLVFAHTSGATLFGAERSFLDMIARLARDGLVPVVVMPSLQNPDYLEQLLEIAAVVEVLPQSWRNGLHPPHQVTVNAIIALIRKHQACEVHVNTLTLEAPLLAARAEGVPGVVYVRELPLEDSALCRTLGMGPNALRQKLLDQADHFIMPSEVVSDWLGCRDRCTVRPNSVDETLFDLPFKPGRILKVGMISSNITKKGIGDFVSAARMIAAMGPAIRFLLIGPQTPDLQGLNPLPPNVQTIDYAPSPAEAIAQVDVVASLSHFAESFGRTVVEAMAAGRPVICYDRGAPPSLVVSGETGIVVPADSVTGVTDAVLALDVARLQLSRISRAARRRAREIQDQALA